MISFLIPTYNYNVFPLAASIEKLAISAEIEFEIISIDDGSNSEINVENEKINQLKNGKFIAKKANVGLSQNRNNLAELSQFEYLVFIDGDSKVINDDYIKNYVTAINNDTGVIYGGRIHPKTIEPNRKLRWKYGLKHEDKDHLSRSKTKYKSVLFNNTLIKKTLFNTIYFEKSITQYGHEDTIFAYQLSQKKANITHIENPIMHDDVDLNTVFFTKTHKSIENLNYIYNQKIIDPSFITFLKAFIKIKKYHINVFFAFLYDVLHPIFKWNLTSKTPSLYIFNLFRLSYFCNINLKK